MKDEVEGARRPAFFFLCTLSRAGRWTLTAFRFFALFLFALFFLFFVFGPRIVDARPTHSYRITASLMYWPAHVTTIVLVKLGAALDMLVPLAPQQ
ncbi:hypothetical protein DFH11DRAFT_1556967 [Phellopilus nigrolimitatus]|nr:hypothetical protein DFH11DRAFT_1556967 [Phellopilus nigrolimitatus]